MSRKRFTDADKWKDAWFCAQTPIIKLFWLYLCDECGQEGAWEVNWPLAHFHLGPFDEVAAAAAVASRIMVIKGGRKWFIPGFIKFQYPSGLSVTSPPHRRIRQSLTSHGIDPDTLLDSLREGVSSTPEEVEKEDVFSERESPERARAPTPPAVPANLSPKLRDTYRDIAEAEGGGAVGYEAATRALRASQIQFGTPTPAQLNVVYQTARKAGCVAKPPDAWPHFVKSLAAEKLRDQSKTTATHTADDAAQYAALDARHRQ